MRFDLLDEFASVYTLRSAIPADRRRHEVSRPDGGRSARRAALTVIVVMIGLSTGGAWFGF